MVIKFFFTLNFFSPHQQHSAEYYPSDCYINKRFWLVGFGVL